MRLIGEGEGMESKENVTRRVIDGFRVKVTNGDEVKRGRTPEGEGKDHGEGKVKRKGKGKGMLKNRMKGCDKYRFCFICNTNFEIFFTSSNHLFCSAS